MTTYRCASCGLTFQPRPQSPEQRFCSLAECQRERKRRWQHFKRQTDPDYRDNQARAQREWASQHAGYWLEYRNAHPQYIEANRLQQQLRNKLKRMPFLARVDGLCSFDPIPSGIYEISRFKKVNAKKDAWTVELTLVVLPWKAIAKR